MRKVIIVGLALALALVVELVVGCGTEQPHRAARPERTTIVFWNENAAADRTGYYRELIAQFEQENPDIHVEYVGLPKKAARLKINTAIATGELPDVCGVQSAWIAEFCDKGVLLNLDEYYSGWEEHDAMLHAVIAANRALVPDGGLYQLPNTMGMEILWYNPNAFAAKNIAPPTSWDEFFAAANALTDGAGHYGYTMRGGDGAAIQLMRTLYAYSGITEFFDASGHCTLNDPAHVAFLTRYIALYGKATPTSDITNGYQEMVVTFDTGEAAMMQHNLGSYGSHLKTLSDGEFAPLLLPLSVQGTIMQEANNVDGYGIFKSSKNPAAAWRFVAFLCSARTQSWWNEHIGQMPVNKLALDDEWVSRAPHMRLARAALADPRLRFYQPPMYIPEYRRIVDDADKGIQYLLMGEMTAQQFLDKWASDFESAKRDYDAANHGAVSAVK